MISEDSSYENQDEIQKKFDQIDKKEVLSLNDEWFEKFEDLDENGTNEEHIDNNDSNDVYDNNWNNLFYGNQEIDLNNITRILEVIKEENALLKKKEQNIKGNFEKLKYDYTRIAKEKKLVENKINRIFLNQYI